MRKLILAVFMLLPFAAHAQTATDVFGRTITCTGNGPVTCANGDGTSIQAPTAAQALGTFNGMAPSSYVPPPPPPATTIDPLGFMARLTPAEQSAIASAGQSNAQILLFLLKLSGAQQVTVTDPLTVAGVNAMVAAGLLTAPRGAQILNLAVASP